MLYDGVQKIQHPLFLAKQAAIPQYRLQYIIDANK